MKIKTLHIVPTFVAVAVGSAAVAHASGQAPTPQTQTSSSQSHSTAKISEESSGQLTDAQIDSLERAAYGNARNLEEVIISADAPMIKVEGNQITYNVEEDPSSSGSNVLDMLRKVPMVSVDGQDNIQVKGNGDFKIYVNGRPDPMLSQNASVVLKAMPAESVTSVELITDPGAKYDAEGSGAIINLITVRKQRDTGYNGMANLSVDNRNLQAGVNGAYKYDRLNLNAGVNYSFSYPGARKAKTDDQTIYLNNPSEHRMRERATNTQDIDFLGVNLGGSYDLAEHDLLTFSANFYDVTGDIKVRDQKTEMFSEEQELLWSYSRISDLSLTYRGVTAQAAYQHEFGRKDNYLGLTYQFNFNTVGLPGTFTYGDAFNYHLEHLYQRNDNNRVEREHTVQLDWADRLTSHAKIELGAKGIFRYNSAFGQTSVSDDLVLLTPVEGTDVNMRQPQEIYAAYGQYTAYYGNLTASAGVRYEHTRMGIRYRNDEDKDFTSYLNDVVPNASVTYSFSPARSLSANYSMRISRPSIEQLNPYPLELSNLRVQMGNPDLTSERINKVGISYNSFGRSLGGSVTLDYTDSHNAITTFAYLNGLQLVQSYANIGSNRSANLSLFLTWSASQKLRFSLNAGAKYTSLKADMELIGGKVSNHGFSGNFNLNAIWSLPEHFELAGYGGWRSRNYELLGTSGEFHYYGLTLNRTFLKDNNLKLSLNLRNCFEKYNTFSSTSHTADSRSTNVWKNPAWSVGVAVSWTFGKNQAHVKQTNSSILNDDVSNAKANTGVN